MLKSTQRLFYVHTLWLDNLTKHFYRLVARKQVETTTAVISETDYKAKNG